MEVALLSEIWEQSQSERQKHEIEKMMEFEGLSYLSFARHDGKRGGGVAIIADCEKFHLEKIDIKIPNNLEVIWAYLKPKSKVLNKFLEQIVLCSFYSPKKLENKNKMN